MKKGGLFVLLFIILIVFFHFVSADILSLNSGGSKEIVINPETYIEGFFSGDFKVLSTCGNGVLETPYEQCDDGNYVSGDGCSSTCKNEGNNNNNNNNEEEPPIPGQPYIRIDPKEIKRAMLINSNIEESIGITNLNRTASVNFSVNSSGFDPNLIVSFWDEKSRQWINSLSLTIAPRKIYELRVRFSAPGEIGVYNGTIFIDGKNASVSLNVQRKLLLFDSNIIVLNPDYLVSQGEKLRTSVTLIPLGEKERLDVTLNYIIKDPAGNVYLTRSETVLVEDQINFKRNFDTGILPVGSYIIGLELIYPNGVAPSSAHFEVVPGRQNSLFGRIVFFVINLILILLILIIILLILRIIKKIRENRKEEKKKKFLEDLNSKEKLNSDEKKETKTENKTQEKDKPKDKEKITK
jgi:cysteine-rich repeat protein